MQVYFFQNFREENNNNIYSGSSTHQSVFQGGLVKKTSDPNNISEEIFPNL